MIEQNSPLQKTRRQQRLEKVRAEMAAFTMPRYSRLPEIELYMDQLVNCVNRVLAPLSSADSSEELLLTKSMVNNYVKQRVLPPPEKKRYDRRHLAMLLMLCPLKQVCSIPECVQLLRLTERQSGKTPQQNYDAFCASLESAVHSCFGQQEHVAPQGLILPRMTQTIADKIFLQKMLYCEDCEE